MKDLKRILGSMAFVIFLFTTSAYSSVQPIILVSGGYGSCPDQNIYSKIAGVFLRYGLSTQMHEQLRHLKIDNHLQKRYGSSPIWVFSCFSDLDIFDSKNLYLRFGKVSKLSSEKSGKKIYEKNKKNYSLIKYENFYQVNFDQTEQKIDFMDPLKGYINTLVKNIKKKGKDTRLFIFGHSYGGFVGMEIADIFKSSLKGLATIDPISPIKCIARDMVFDPIGTIKASRLGCQLAPNDQHSKKNIKSLINHLAKSDQAWWYNVYQRTFTYLRSAAILPVLYKNGEAKFVEYPNNREYKKAYFYKTDGDAHSQFVRLESYWSDVYHNYISTR